MRWALLLACAALGCNRVKPRVDERACASACAALAGADCAPEERTRCAESCRNERALARDADCTQKYEAFLSCLSQGGNSCISQADEAVAKGLHVERCASAYAAYARCAEACREQGVVRTATRHMELEGREHSVAVELVTRGCGRALPPAPGAAPGSRCEHYSVCAGVECACASPSEGYRVRACVDSRCAEPALGCRLAPLGVDHAVCRP